MWFPPLPCNLLLFCVPMVTFDIAVAPPKPSSLCATLFMNSLLSNTIYGQNMPRENFIFVISCIANTSTPLRGFSSAFVMSMKWWTIERDYVTRKATYYSVQYVKTYITGVSFARIKVKIFSWFSIFTEKKTRIEDVYIGIFFWKHFLWPFATNRNQSIYIFSDPLISNLASKSLYSHFLSPHRCFEVFLKTRRILLDRPCGAGIKVSHNNCPWANKGASQLQPCQNSMFLTFSVFE